MSEIDPPQFLMPRDRALQDAIDAMLERGIGSFRFVPRADGFAIVRPAPADAPPDEVLLEETVFTSNVCDYGSIEACYARGGLFRWGHACVLDVRVERHPREMACELYVRLEPIPGETPARGGPAKVR